MAKTPAKAMAAAQPTSNRFWHGWRWGLLSRDPTAPLLIMSTTSLAFPELGFGLGLRTNHYSHIFEYWPTVDWFEIISENFMDTQGKARRNLARIREHYPVVMHGVSLSIGSVDVLDSDYLRQLKALADDIEPAWISDHLCWTGVAHQNLHDLLPVPYTEEALRHLVRRVQQVQEYLGRPIALENPSTYLEFASSSIPEAEFLAELSRQSGCFLLLDVNNVHVSCFNHRMDPLKYIDSLPLERVVQIHLSGHSHMGTHIIDTHDQPVVDEVLSLYAYTLARAGRVPNSMVEWDAQIPPWEVLYAELDKVKAVAARVQAREKTSEETSERVDPQACAPAQGLRPSVIPVNLVEEQLRLLDNILSDREPPAQALDWIRPKAGFAACEQLGVYHHAYRSRLFEVVAEDFPVLRHLLGETAFEAVVSTYVAQTPSRHFNIARYLSAFSEHVERVLPEQVLAHEVTVLETALSELQDAGESPALTSDDLSRLEPQALLEAVFSLRVASRLLTFSHAVDPYYTAVREGEDVPPAPAGTNHLLVFRHEDVVWRMRLETAEFALLSRLAGGQPLGVAVAALEAQTAEAGQVTEAAVSGWFSRWIRHGVFAQMLH